MTGGPAPAPAASGPGLDEATARRRFVAVSFLFWLPIGMSLAPAVLLFTERGMGLAAIAGFFAAHSLTAAAMELPTGGFSDVIGRRAVLATAGLFNLTALTLLGLGTDAWVFVLGMALVGSARALSSGPAEAWYVDTVHLTAGPDADVRTGLARGSSAVSVALALGTLLGGALPWLLGLGPDPGAWLTDVTSGLVLPLSVPALLGAAVEVVFVLHVLRALPEPPRPKATLRTILSGVPGVIADGLRLGARDALIRRVLMTASATGAALAALELLTPGRAAALTGAAESGAVLFAALACAGFACAALGSQLAPEAARLTGSSERAVLAGLGAGAAGLTLLGITAATASATDALATATAAAGYGLVYLGLGIAGPNGNDLLHRRVDSSGRTTALSVQSLALQLCGAGAGLVAGVLPLGPLPWLLAAAVLLMGALLWVRRAAPEPTESVRLDGDTHPNALQETRPHA
jgi:MFS family permease